MPPEDRLAELIRQRALVAEHLQWLDREIARASASQSLPSQPLADRPAAAKSPTEKDTAPVFPPDDDASATPKVELASLPVAAPTVNLLTSASNAAKPAEPAPADVIGVSRVQDIRSQTRSGCLLWVIVGVVLFVATIIAMISMGRLMRPEPKPEDTPEKEKTGALVLPLAQQDSRA